MEGGGRRRGGYFNHPSYYGGTIRPAPTGHVASGSGPLGAIAHTISGIQYNLLKSKVKHGTRVESVDPNTDETHVDYETTRKSFMVGARMSTAGVHHQSVFDSEVIAADKWFAQRSAYAANRNNPAAIRQLERDRDYRKMRAAMKFYGYQRDIGFISEQEYRSCLRRFAKDNNIAYEDDLDHGRGSR